MVNCSSAYLKIAYGIHEVKTALAIVKIDEKEMFLDVKNEQNEMIVNGIDGINVKKINNMVVIVDMGQDEMPAVFYENEKERRCRVLARAFFKTQSGGRKLP